MTKLDFPLLVLSIIGLLASPALAKPVLHFKSAHDAAARDPEGVDPFVPKEKALEGVPKGLPGFFDPATQTFNPLSSYAAPAAGPPAAGTVSAAIHISSEKGIGPDDTVFCDFIVEFGNVAGTPPQWFPNHSVRASANFAAGEPGVVIDAPFSYTPNGNGTPYMRVSLQCHINSAADGTAHSSADYHAVQAIGNANVPFNMSF